MSSKITNFILPGAVLLVVLAGAITYPILPDQVASHWNAAGEADGYMDKFWGIFLLPLVMAGMYLFYFIIPKIDPLKKNIESFRPTYNTFWLWMFVFLLYIFGLSMVWNFGYRFNFTMAIVPAIAAFLYIIGVVLEKSKRNWFVGIRTPWTLSNDVVWDKTHKLGGRLFKVAAVISLLGLFLRGELPVLAVLAAPVAIVAVVTIVYSYVEFRKNSD